MNNTLIKKKLEELLIPPNCRKKQISIYLKEDTDLKLKEIAKELSQYTDKPITKEFLITLAIECLLIEHGY